MRRVASRRVAFLVVFSLCSATATAAEDYAEERTLDMEVGQQLTLSAVGVDKFSEGIPGIVEVRAPRDASHFVLVALAPGTTTLLLLMKSGRNVNYTMTVRPREVLGLVKARPNIRLDFYFVQLAGESAYRVGIGWPGTIGGQAQIGLNADLASGETAATASVAASVLPRIDMAQAKGWVRIHRQATLIVANGEQGAFSSGGELNVLVEGKLATGIEKIRSGTDIVVRPRYDSRTGRSEIHLTADVSELTAAEGGLPGRTQAHVETVVNLDHGQAVILAGLQARTETRGRSGFPLLSQIPILGALFGTHSGDSVQSENLVFIVPTVIEPVAIDKRDLVQSALRVYGGFQGETGEIKKIIEGQPRGKKP